RRFGWGVVWHVVLWMWRREHRGEERDRKQIAKHVGPLVRAKPRASHASVSARCVSGERLDSRRRCFWSGGARGGGVGRGDDATSAHRDARERKGVATECNRWRARGKGLAAYRQRRSLAVLLIRRGRLVRTARVMTMGCQRGCKALGRLSDESEVQHQSTNNQTAESARLHSLII